jgi:hypothetical protein
LTKNTECSSSKSEPVINDVGRVCRKRNRITNNEDPLKYKLIPPRKSKSKGNDHQQDEQRVGIERGGKIEPQSTRCNGEESVGIHALKKRSVKKKKSYPAQRIEHHDQQ